MELHVRKTLQLASRLVLSSIVRILASSRAIDADRENRKSSNSNNSPLELFLSLDCSSLFLSFFFPSSFRFEIYQAEGFFQLRIIFSPIDSLRVLKK